MKQEPPSPPPKHYVLVRDDLPLGMLAAQVVHAAGESAAFRAPPPGCHAVVLAASVAELHRLEVVLRTQGFLIAAIYENDAPYENELMAIGIAPVSPGVPRWVRHLPLLREKAATP